MDIFITQLRRHLRDTQTLSIRIIAFVFGKETKGLPEEIIKDNLDRSIRIPMIRDLGRSLNLANSVNIIIYEALRQLDFPNLE